MKTTDHGKFGEVWIPSGFQDLMEFVAGTVSEPSAVRMWRGQAKSEWLLHSSAQRKLSAERNPVKENILSAYETNLLKQATHRGYRYVDGRELSDFELLARLQHHGAATRLIDTTRNFLVALYFACCSEGDSDGMVFGIHSDHLGGYEGLLLDGDYKTIVAGAGLHSHPQTWEPPVVSKRVAAQSSQFVYSAIVDQLHGSLAIDDCARGLLAIQIEASLKAGFMTILERTFDVRLLTLFPDIDGFGLTFGQDRDQYFSQRW